VAGPTLGRPSLHISDLVINRCCMTNNSTNLTARLYMLIEKIEHIQKSVQKLKSRNNEIVKRDWFQEDIEQNSKRFAIHFGWIVAMFEGAFRGYHEGNIL